MHPCYLKEKDIESIVDILFQIYNKCYYINSQIEKIYIEKNMIIEDVRLYYTIKDRLKIRPGNPGTKYVCLVFENK